MVLSNATDVLTFNLASNLEFTGIISGSWRLTKTGTGTVTLSGTNSYGGGTTVIEGVLIAAILDAIPDYDVPSTIEVQDGGAVGGRISIGGSGWSEDDIIELRDNANWANTGAALAIDTSNVSIGLYTTTLSDPSGKSIGLLKLGANTLSFALNNRLYPK